MRSFDAVKNIGKSIFERGKKVGGKVLKETKINAEIFALSNEIKKSKVKLGDMIYQLDVDTGIKDIDDLKKLIKNALDEIKYLESKKKK